MYDLVNKWTNGFVKGSEHVGLFEFVSIVEQKEDYEKQKKVEAEKLKIFRRQVKFLRSHFIISALCM